MRCATRRRRTPGRRSASARASWVHLRASSIERWCVLTRACRIRLQQGNLPEALDLLPADAGGRQQFENLAASGALLEQLNHPAEALEFRRARVQAVPWDRMRSSLARAEIAAQGRRPDRDSALERLSRIATSPLERYALRVEAARAFAAGVDTWPRAADRIDWLRAAKRPRPPPIGRSSWRRGSPQQTRSGSVTRITLLRAAIYQSSGLARPQRAALPCGACRRKPANAVERFSPSSPAIATCQPGSDAAACRVWPAAGEAYARSIAARAVRYFTIALEGQTAAARADRLRPTAVNDEISHRARNAARRPRIGRRSINRSS